MWLIFHARIKFKPCQKKGPQQTVVPDDISPNFFQVMTNIRYGLFWAERLLRIDKYVASEWYETTFPCN